MRHHSIGSNDAPLADYNPRHDNRVAPNPAVVANIHLFIWSYAYPLLQSNRQGLPANAYHVRDIAYQSN